MKIALVHDYLREYGGAERVVEALHELYPQAPLYTSFVDWNALGIHAARFKSWDIRTSWVQRNWLVRKYHSPLRFLAPLIWESLDLREFEVVISSSGWYICRGVITRPETMHISYIHHPPRNLYGYETASKNALVSAYAVLINPYLRMYDFTTAQRVDHLVANSKETQSRIQKFYRRDSTVIYPPVEVMERGKGKEEKGKDTEYFLSVGRLTYAKRVDLAIEACNKLQLPLKIVGKGREEKYLRSIAGSSIEFLGEVKDEQLKQFYSQARALIFCGLQEDFGLVPVESMAHGTPVVALGQGGVAETVVDGKTGVLFNEPKLESLISAINKLNDLKTSINRKNCISQANKFSKEKFSRKMSDFVNNKFNEHNKF